jgi:hypothetical protein
MMVVSASRIDWITGGESDRIEILQGISQCYVNCSLQCIDFWIATVAVENGRILTPANWPKKIIALYHLNPVESNKL